MTLNEYQQQARQTAVYPGQDKLDGLLYTILGLCGEAGEMANQAKKILRDDQGTVTTDRLQKLWDETGDCLWYVAIIAHETGVDLEWLAGRNLRKLAERKQTGTLRGDRRAS